MLFAELYIRTNFWQIRFVCKICWCMNNDWIKVVKHSCMLSCKLKQILNN